jgi:hypothetical protein
MRLHVLDDDTAEQLEPKSSTATTPGVPPSKGRTPAATATAEQLSGRDAKTKRCANGVLASVHLRN